MMTAGESVHVELAPHTSHLPERFGLFTMIVLGESVLAVVNGVAKQHWNVSSAIAAVFGMSIAFSLWWVYFDNLGFILDIEVEINYTVAKKINPVEEKM